MDLVVLDGEREDEAAEDVRDDVVHVGLGDSVGGGDAEEREQEERRHGGDGERHGARDPPEEDVYCKCFQLFCTYVASISSGVSKIDRNAPHVAMCPTCHNLLLQLLGRCACA